MSRLARRIRMGARTGSRPAPARFNPEQHYLETALRGRAARKARAHLRRMEPVVLLTPRWGASARFLEDLALDLAVGEPAIGCRTVDLRPLKDRSAGEAWQYIQHVFGKLGQRGWRGRPPTTIADRRGFRWSLEQLVEEVHASAPHRVALLAHGAEHLPFDVIEDLTSAWDEYTERHPEGRRLTLLLAGSRAARWLRVGDAPRLDLADFGEAEAAAAIVGQAGPMPLRHLEQVARFTGGIPSLVDAVGAAARERGTLPLRRADLIGSMGRLADEMRGAVDIVAACDPLADRLHALIDGAAAVQQPEVDGPLLQAGLLREVRAPGGDQVALRAPAIAALVG